MYFLLAHALLTGVMGVEDKDQKPQNYEPNMDSVGFNAESVVAGMVAPLQALRELLLWPVMYSKEAASLGLRWPKGLLLYGPPGTVVLLSIRHLLEKVRRYCGKLLVRRL